jgi:hypothetical protein
MKLSKEEVYEKLGLMQPKDFFNNIAWKDPYERITHLSKLMGTQSKNFLHHLCYDRTGQTTNMLVDALVKLSEGKKVCVQGYSEKFSRILTRELKQYTQKLGLNLNLIQDQPSEDTILFIDHFKLYE